MPRRVQDIIPPDRRTIRNIPVKPAPARAASPIAPSTNASAAPSPRARFQQAPLTPPPRRHKRRSKRLPIVLSIIGAVVVLAIAGAVVSARFAQATFTIVPRSVTSPVGGTYTFSSAGAASYSVISVPVSASASVPASAGGFTQSKAQGTITLYNSFSTQVQRLVAGTRLSDDTGRIYRLTGSISIPGYRSSTSGTIPGSIPASVVADQPGSSYNISGSDSVSDFKVIAYAGTPKQGLIYGRLTSDIVGGFSGVKIVIAPALLASTTDDLKSSAVATAQEKLQALVPADSVLFKSALFPSFSAPVIAAGNASGTASISVKGTLYAALFKRSDLAVLLAGKAAVSSFEGFSFDAVGLDSLAFMAVNTKDFSPASKNDLIARIDGSITLRGSIPVDELKKKFAGASLSATPDILKPYSPIIESGSGELSPPWAHVPSDPARITVVVSDK